MNGTTKKTEANSENGPKSDMQFLNAVMPHPWRNSAPIGYLNIEKRDFPFFRYEMWKKFSKTFVINVMLRYPTDIVKPGSNAWRSLYNNFYNQPDEEITVNDYQLILDYILELPSFVSNDLHRNMDGYLLKYERIERKNNSPARAEPSPRKYSQTPVPAAVPVPAPTLVIPTALPILAPLPNRYYSTMSQVILGTPQPFEFSKPHQYIPGRGTKRTSSHSPKMSSTDTKSTKIDYGHVKTETSAKYVAPPYLKTPNKHYMNLPQTLNRTTASRVLHNKPTAVSNCGADSLEPRPALQTVRSNTPQYGMDSPNYAKQFQLKNLRKPKTCITINIGNNIPRPYAAQSEMYNRYYSSLGNIYCSQMQDKSLKKLQSLKPDKQINLATSELQICNFDVNEQGDIIFAEDNDGNDQDNKCKAN